MGKNCVLVVEDDAGVRECLTDILSREGFVRPFDPRIVQGWDLGDTKCLREKLRSE